MDEEDVGDSDVLASTQSICDEDDDEGTVDPIINTLDDKCEDEAMEGEQDGEESGQGNETNESDHKTPEIFNKNGLENVLDENTDVLLEFDADKQDYETVIVMNEKSKFNSRFKPDTTGFKNMCHVCDAAFRWPHQLKNHMDFVHEGKTAHECKVCGKIFEHLNSLRDHKYVHTNERPYPCELCDSAFKMKGGLNKHMRDIHMDLKMKFKCEHCPRMFKTKEKLVSHFIVHSEEKLFSCDFCGKKFNRKNNLKEHRITHSLEKNFECEDCGKKFNRKYSLKIHQRNHLEVRPYKCDFCERSFSQSHALKSHIRLHTGERPYKCRYCERSFKQIGTLQVHEKRHTGEKNFTCGVCQRSFIIHRRLQEHLRIHTGEKPYECDHCPYRAATTTGLRCHKKTHERRLHRQLEKERIKNDLDAIKSVIDGVLDGASVQNEHVSVPDEPKVKKKKPKTIATKSTKRPMGTENVLIDSIPEGNPQSSKSTSNGAKKKKQPGEKLFAESLQRIVGSKSTKTNILISEESYRSMSHQMLADDVIDLTDDTDTAAVKQENVAVPQLKGIQENPILKRKKKRMVKKTIFVVEKAPVTVKTNTLSFKEQLFADSLLKGTNLFSAQSFNSITPAKGFVHDVMQDDLSSIDKVIANLANSINTTFGGVKDVALSTEKHKYHASNNILMTNRGDSKLGAMLAKIEPSSSTERHDQIKKEPNSYEIEKTSHGQGEIISLVKGVKREPFDLEMPSPQPIIKFNNNATNQNDLNLTTIDLVSDSEDDLTSNDLDPITKDLNSSTHELSAESNDPYPTSVELMSDSDDDDVTSNDLDPLSNDLNASSHEDSTESNDINPTSGGLVSDSDDDMTSNDLDPITNELNASSHEVSIESNEVNPTSLDLMSDSDDDISSNDLDPMSNELNASSHEDSIELNDNNQTSVNLISDSDDDIKSNDLKASSLEDITDSNDLNPTSVDLVSEYNVDITSNEFVTNVNDLDPISNDCNDISLEVSTESSYLNPTSVDLMPDSHDDITSNNLVATSNDLKDNSHEDSTQSNDLNQTSSDIKQELNDEHIVSNKLVSNTFDLDPISNELNAAPLEDSTVK